MVAAYVNDLERLFSKARLDRYRPANGDDLDTAVRYLWNVALSESLLQGLSMLEVALRNTIHSAFSNHFNTDQWFWAVLRADEIRTVNDTWTKMASQLKHPPPAGKIIAELTFGFWTRLLDARYHTIWWDNHAALFKAAFPHLPTGLPPKQAITLKLIHERAERCKDLRNRVMHHEPIFMGVAQLNRPIVPLVEIHGQIIDLLKWIDPQLALTLGFVDRFKDVFDKEENQIRMKLKTEFKII